MSRAYRITVAESASRTIVAGDEVRSQLELLNILPPESMAKLLKDDLQAREFVETTDGTWERERGRVKVTVDPCNGEVRVRIAATDTATVSSLHDVAVWDDVGPGGHAAAEVARTQMKDELQKRLDRVEGKLQAEISAELEAALADLTPELHAIANKVTRDALKSKAASLGTVTGVHEDDAAGTLTITLEV